MGVLIERVNRSVVVDHFEVSGDEATLRILSVEAFREAQRVESRECPEQAPSKLQQRRPTGEDRPHGETVSLVHAQSGPLNWALFAPKARAQPRRATMPALLRRGEAQLVSESLSNVKVSQCQQHFSKVQKLEFIPCSDVEEEDSVTHADVAPSTKTSDSSVTSSSEA